MSESEKSWQLACESSQNLEQAQNEFYLNSQEEQRQRSQSTHVNQRKLNKLQQLRQAQQKVEILEAEKESLVNKISDQRLLLQKVNNRWETQIISAKSKNTYLKSQIKDLEDALTVARECAKHFDDMRDYWGMLFSKTKYFTEFEPQTKEPEIKVVGIIGQGIEGSSQDSIF